MTHIRRSAGFPPLSGSARFGFPLVFCLLALLSCRDRNPSSPDFGDGSTLEIRASHPFVQYTGRVRFLDQSTAAFDWPGVTIRIRFEGTSCAIRLKDGRNWYDVRVDSLPVRVLPPDEREVVPLADSLDGTVVHTLSLTKRTEAFVGRAEFSGFVLDPGCGLVAPPARPGRRIEFIGNSITCGYGVEGTSASCPFTPATENAARSYAFLAAEALGAEASLVAYSGKGVVRNHGDPHPASAEPMPALFDRTCCADPLPAWDPAAWPPDAVVIALGTNDYSTRPWPDSTAFRNAYQELIDRVRARTPGVRVFCLTGPLIGSPCTESVRAVVSRYRSEPGSVFFVSVPQAVMTPADWGCDWHPNRRGQQKIADALVAEMRRGMGW